MPDYRLDRLHPETGQIESTERLFAADDEAAIRIVREQYLDVPVELWSGARKVTRIDPAPSGSAFAHWPQSEAAD
jgi:hypothetical protein